MIRKTFTSLTSLAFLVTSLLAIHVKPVHADTYKIDPEHSSVSFRIRHLVSKTKGEFRNFEGTIDFDPAKPKNGKAKAVIQVKSIDTNVKKRDEHLLSKDFFDVAKYPEMKFETTKVTKLDGTKGELVGKLTLKGVTKPVIMDVTLGGTGKDPWGNERVGFTGTAKINRKDFGMNYNLEDKTGAPLLGDEVEIMLEIEGIKS